MPPVVLVADSHVGQIAGDEAGLVEFLDTLSPRAATALYLMGDAFHYLIGDRKFMTPAIERALDALRRVKERGLPVHYIEGNRDFYLRGSFLEPNFTDVERDYLVPSTRGPIHLTHGDGINDRDYPYRFWRFVSKNPVAFAAMRAIPERSARRIVSGVEGRLRQSNFKHKRQIPEGKIRRFAEQCFAAGAHGVLLGHFHTEWREDRADGRYVAVVPAWYETGKVGLVEDDGSYRTLDAKDLPAA